MRFSLSSFPEARPHNLERARAAAGRGSAAVESARRRESESRAGRATRPEATQRPSAGKRGVVDGRGEAERIRWCGA